MHPRNPTHPRRLRTAAAFLALIGAVTLSGCSAEPDDDVLVVVNSATDAAEHERNQQAFDRCATQLGITVDQRSTPADQVVPKALRMASSRSLPDILAIDNSQVPQIAQTQGLVPLTDLGFDTDGMLEGAVRAGEFDGEFYGVARSVNALGLFYDADALAAAGIEPPTTWEELETAAAQLTEGDRYGVAFAASPSLDGVFQFLPFLWSNGGDERDLDSPEAAGAVQLWKDLVDDGSASPSVVNWLQSDVNDQFIAGRAAMMVNGPWQVPNLDEVDGLNWQVAKIPVPQAGEEPVVALGGEVMTIPRSTPEREQRAEELISCLNQPSEQLAWAAAGNNIPSRSQAAAEYREEAPELAAIIDQVPAARARTESTGTEWPVAAEAIYGAVQSSLTGQRSVRDALEIAARQVDAALAEQAELEQEENS